MTNEFALSAWVIRDEDTSKISGRLWRKGWIGVNLSHLSEYELSEIKRFLNTKNSSDFFDIPSYVNHSADFFDIKDNNYAFKEKAIWFKTRELYDEFKEFLKKIDDREFSFPVENVFEIDKNINYEFFNVDGVIWLSISDCSKASYYKLAYGI